MIYALDGITPEIDAEAWVAPGAQVMGRVRLAAGVGIWFGAAIRGDNEWIEIGERSQVQDNATMHTDPGFPLTIGSNCVIGHNVMLHGCTVGDNSLIGMSATVLNGAKIGNNSLVGAGAVVTEGKSFPDNSLIVGAPAKAIRTLDDEAVAGHRRSAESYVRNWQRFKIGLKAL